VEALPYAHLSPAQKAFCTSKAAYESHARTCKERLRMAGAVHVSSKTTEVSTPHGTEISMRRLKSQSSQQV